MLPPCRFQAANYGVRRLCKLGNNYAPLDCALEVNCLPRYTSHNLEFRYPLHR